MMQIAFSFSVADLGHSGTGALQEEYGGALLPKRPCHHLCVWCDQPGFIWESAGVDWGVQPSLSPSHGPPHPSWEQMWLKRSERGVHVFSSAAGWQLQLPTFWDVCKRPCRKRARRCHFPHAGLQAEESQAAETETAKWEQLLTARWRTGGEHTLFMLMHFGPYSFMQ